MGAGRGVGSWRPVDICLLVSGILIGSAGIVLFTVRIHPPRDGPDHNLEPRQAKVDSVRIAETRCDDCIHAVRDWCENNPDEEIDWQALKAAKMMPHPEEYDEHHDKPGKPEHGSSEGHEGHERDGDRDSHERDGDRESHERDGDRESHERDGDREGHERDGDREGHMRESHEGREHMEDGDHHMEGDGHPMTGGDEQPEHPPQHPPHYRRRRDDHQREPRMGKKPGDDVHPDELLNPEWWKTVLVGAIKQKVAALKCPVVPALYVTVSYTEGDMAVPALLHEDAHHMDHFNTHSYSECSYPEDKDDKHRDGKRRGGKHTDGERRDGERPDDEHKDGMHPDGERPDGEHTDGKHPDGERPDGEHHDGMRSDGMRPDGMHPDGTHHPDGMHPDGTHHPDGMHPDGMHPDGTRPDGMYPAGEHPDGDHPEGEHDGTNPRVRRQAPETPPGDKQPPSGGDKMTELKEKFEQLMNDGEEFTVYVDPEEPRHVTGTDPEDGRPRGCRSLKMLPLILFLVTIVLLVILIIRRIRARKLAARIRDTQNKPAIYAASEPAVMVPDAPSGKVDPEKDLAALGPEVMSCPDYDVTVLGGKTLMLSGLGGETMTEKEAEAFRPGTPRENPTIPPVYASDAPVDNPPTYSSIDLRKY